MHFIAVVANPTKLDDPARTRDDLRRVVEARGGRLRWYETTEQDPGHGQARQALADGAEVVGALGGDGTVRAVATELVGGPVPLGLLPGDTGNLLARNLHTPVDSLERALVAALDGTTQHIDVGYVQVDDRDEEVFLVMAGVGLDAETMAAATESVKARVGWLAYGLAGARKLVGTGFDADVTVDGAHQRHRSARQVLVGNCGMVQGDFELFPDARLDDGSLDLLVLAPKGAGGWAKAAMRLVAQRRRSHGALQHGCGTGIEVQTGQPVQAEIDGDEVGRARRLVFHVERSALPVRVPKEHPLP